jgi:E3 ubiquitin-protein ligase DOA10
LYINSISHPETTTMAVPDGASCYICLDEGPDEEGKPLVRDCSCRGDTAGFAHLSCIIEYAKQKKKKKRRPTWTRRILSRHGKNATTAINRSKIKWRWIYPLHLFRSRRKPTTFLETASGIN